MPRFTNAIVRTPCRNMTRGITSAELGLPDTALALHQHENYIRALRELGLNVTILKPDERFPDSTFVEDTALLTPGCAIITRPGAPSRRREIDAMRDVVSSFYDRVETIHAPGTVDAGDILMAGDHYFIGLSRRTNAEGARQTIEILRRHGFQASTVPLEHVLHLKSGVAYIENNTMVISGEFTTFPAFERFTHIEVKPEEAYAANCVWINGTVLVARDFPFTAAGIRAAGYDVTELDMSEFQKLDGGLSCLSLRF